MQQEFWDNKYNHTKWYDFWRSFLYFLRSLLQNIKKLSDADSENSSFEVQENFDISVKDKLEKALQFT